MSLQPYFLSRNPPLALVVNRFISQPSLPFIFSPKELNSKQILFYFSITAWIWMIICNCYWFNQRQLCPYDWWLLYYLTAVSTIELQEQWLVSLQPKGFLVDKKIQDWDVDFRPIKVLVQHQIWAGTSCVLNVLSCSTRYRSLWPSPRKLTLQQYMPQCFANYVGTNSSLYIYPYLGFPSCRKQINLNVSEVHVGI